MATIREFSNLAQLGDLDGVITVSASRNIATTDHNKALLCGGGVTLTVLKDSLPIGFRTVIINNFGGVMTTVTGSDIAINYTGTASITRNKVLGVFGRAELRCLSGNWFGLTGDVTAMYPGNLDFDLFSGLVAQNVSIQMTTTSFTPASGTIYLTRLVAARTVNITRLALNISTGGSGLSGGSTANGLALYDTGGNRLALVDGSSWFAGSSGMPTLGSAITVTAGTTYFIAVVATGSTMPQLSAAPANGEANFMTSASPWNNARSTSTGTLTATLNLSTGWAQNTTRWYGALFE